MPASILADNLAAQITTRGGGLIPATTATSSGNCITLTTGLSPAVLRVGPPNNPSCIVTATGCDYNPVIRLITPEQLASVPLLNEWGVGASILFIIIAIVLIRRRRRILIG